MKKRTKRLVSGLALVTGALSVTFLLRRRRNTTVQTKRELEGRGRTSADRWARPGMSVTFRAELMPGRGRSERTFRVTELRPSGRVLLEGFAGEHAEPEFERLR